MNLHQPLHVLPGVGPKSAEKYAKLGIENLQDLLLYFPFRYEDFKTKQVLELEDGEKAVLSGQVVTPASVQYYGFKRNRLRFSLKQGEVVFAVNFFNQPYLADKIELGATLAVFGKWDRAKVSLTGMKVLAQVEDDLQPVYRLAQGISQASLVKVIKTAFDQGLDLLIEENLPQSLLDKYKLMSRCQAVRAMHFPKDLVEYKQALRRIKFEELFYFQMQLQTLKSENRVQGSGLVLDWSQEKVTEVKERLPFALTQAQEKSLQEILTDMKSDHHMNRLLQGDVGSGKTLVALFSMLLSVDNGYQACMMAPTEILARQHYASLCEYLAPLGIEVGLLIGSTKKKERTRLLADLSTGALKIIVGTHALLEPVVQFAHLGLAVIDEQHRFGVVQRSGLWQKGEQIHPHILIMSATPIPRTLAMTLYGDLDISVIDELPPGRKPIETYHQSESEMYRVYQFLERQLEEGRQAYVVFPMIEESEEESMRTLDEGFRRYSEHFAHRKIVRVHGKMKPDEKDEAMRSFVSGEAQILLATTVIEVGVNVPNASVMVIEGANRFGLSQLHQLRGRVGRGASQSYCILVTGKDLGEDAKRRIAIMVETNDGFVIAEEDMRLRGFGEIDGTRQSGQQLSLRIANPALDGAMVQYTRTLAEEILSEDPDLQLAKNEILRHRLHEIYYERPSWSQIS